MGRVCVQGIFGRPRYFFYFPQISKVLVRKTANTAIAMYTKISESMGLDQAATALYLYLLFDLFYLPLHCINT
jgi:hypothetical protein